MSQHHVYPSDEHILNTVCANVRAARIAANLDIESVAVAADLAPERIAAIESAVMELTTVDLLRISRALDLPPATLLEGIESARQDRR